MATICYCTYTLCQGLIIPVMGISTGKLGRLNRLATKKNNVNFKIPNFATTHYEGAFVITAIRLWQELPSDINNSKLIFYLHSFCETYLDIISDIKAHTSYTWIQQDGHCETAVKVHNLKT
ncbi:Protein of unknown function [Cotesia congregata]|uniref:Uncharacterized protein n=1 Tax=Cotesia congregata TaxID=51543 RepID=A0A8J2HK73_COTCN|nr:Protein of unknown function [Cotesia congregata]